MVQALRFGTNSRRMLKAMYLSPMKVTYSHSGFHNGQASYIKKILVFVEPGHIQIFLNHCLNLSYGQKYCPFNDHTNITYNLQLLSLLQRLR